MTDDQPPEEPYEIDDRVRIRLEDDDIESPFEGTVCRVVHVFVDGPELDADADSDAKAELDADADSDAKAEPPRETAPVAYRLEDVESGETLPIVLLHRDLRPATDA